MIAEILEPLACVVSFVIGAVMMRSKDKRLQCSAQVDAVTHRAILSSSFEVKTVGRCCGLVDPRCDGGNCTFHCRSQNHCKGKCLDG